MDKPLIPLSDIKDKPPDENENNQPQNNCDKKIKKKIKIDNAGSEMPTSSKGANTAKKCEIKNGFLGFNNDNKENASISKTNNKASQKLIVSEHEKKNKYFGNKENASGQNINVSKILKEKQPKNDVKILENVILQENLTFKNTSKMEDNVKPQTQETQDTQDSFEDDDTTSMEFDDETSNSDEYIDSFTTVKRKRFHNNVNIDILNSFKTTNSVLNKNVKVNDTNRFSLLGELEIESETIPINNRSKGKGIEKVPSLSKKDKFCPPIFLFNVNIKNLIDQLKAKNINFKIVNKSRYKSKLYLTDIKAHSEMMTLLKNKQIDSYSFTPKELKRKSLVLRGLFFKTEIEDIKEELDLKVPGIVNTVTRFQTNFSRKNGTDTNLFLVTLETGKRSEEITSIRYILNQLVYWENPNANQKEVQCWRCQKWGHFSNNCNRQFACVKCDKKHNPGECELVNEDNSKPFCVNCEKFGHPASWRGCPKYKSYIKYRKKLSNDIRNRNNIAAENVRSSITNSSYRREGQTFANCFERATPSGSTNNARKPPLIEEFMKVAKKLCGEETLTLEDKLRNFLDNYKSFSKEQAKSICLDLLQDIYSQYGP